MGQGRPQKLVTPIPGVLASVLHAPSVASSGVNLTSAISGLVYGFFSWSIYASLCMSDRVFAHILRERARFRLNSLFNHCNRSTCLGFCTAEAQRAQRFLWLALRPQRLGGKMALHLNGYQQLAPSAAAR